MTRPGGSERLRPEDRLRRKVEFDRAYATGERTPSRHFTLIVRPAERGRPRLGVTISKAVGNAVVRNAVRRRLREIFRRHRGAMDAPLDVVVHVKPGAGDASYAELEAEMLRSFRRHADRRRHQG